MLHPCPHCAAFAGASQEPEDRWSSDASTDASSDTSGAHQHWAAGLDPDHLDQDADSDAPAQPVVLADLDEVASNGSSMSRSSSCSSLSMEGDDHAYGDLGQAADGAGVAGARVSKRLHRCLRNALEPVTPGKPSTLTSSYRMGSLKLTGRLADKAVDSICQHICSFLPDGHTHPPSFHLVKRILRCTDPADVEYHLCPSCFYRWPHLAHDQFKQHKDDACQHCGHHRFILPPAAVICGRHAGAGIWE
jgi:hypothetical protein